MNTMRVLYHLALADFYERTRRYRFLLTLAAVIYLGVLVNNGTLFLSLAPSNPLDPNAFAYRGEFNSAWIGTMTVLVTNSFLGLFGFYLVSDCIKRDIRTGVGQIIATTPVSRAAYLVGKWISNCLVLFVLVLAIASWRSLSATEAPSDDVVHLDNGVVQPGGGLRGIDIVGKAVVETTAGSSGFARTRGPAGASLRRK